MFIVWYCWLFLGFTAVFGYLRFVLVCLYDLLFRWFDLVVVIWCCCFVLLGCDCVLFY